MREVLDAFHTLTWQALFGQVPSASQRAHDFGWNLVDRFGYEQCQELLRFFASWEHYHPALYLKLQKFQALAGEYIEGLEAPKPKGVHTVPVEEMIPGQIRAFRLHVAFETFYFHAKILLERIATTAMVYFGMKPAGSGSAHHHLVLNLKKFWAYKTRSEVPEGLFQQLRDLNQRVVHFRNVRIEHVGPGDVAAGLGFSWSRPEVGALVVWATIMKDDMTIVQSDPPEEILKKIGRYTITMVEFLEANVGHSVLAAATSSSKS